MEGTCGVVRAESSVCAVCYTCVHLCAAPPVPPSPPGITLRQAAKRHGVFIGTATNVGDFKTAGPLYKQVEQAQFSLTTASPLGLLLFLQHGFHHTAHDT